MHSYYLILLLCGASAGFLSGLIGIGGGFVVVPLLMYALPYIGVPTDMVMKMAIGTSMAVMVPTTLFSLLHEARSNRSSQNSLAKAWVTRLCLAAGLGSVVGTTLIKHIDYVNLTLLFLAYMTYAAILMLRPVKKSQPVLNVSATLTAAPMDVHNVWINRLPSLGIGAFIGGFSSLVGLGGATMVVMYLTSRRISMHVACVVANAMAFSLALASTATVVASGQASDRIHWPAVAIMAVASIVFSAWGVRMKNRTKQEVLRQIFGGMLLLVVAVTLYKIYS